MGLRVIGNGDFAQIGTARWKMGGLNELDALELVYQGAYSKLDTFRNGLQKWSASRLDSNMFLETWSDDGDSVKPTVTLRFIGCKNGKLPPPATSYGNSLATATTTDGELQLSVLYNSPHAKVSVISNTPSAPNAGTPGTPTVLDRRLNGNIPPAFNLQAQIAFALAEAGATEEQQAAIAAKLAQVAPQLNAVKQRILNYFKHAFTPRTLIEFDATPLVPDKYWLCTSTASSILESAI